MSSGLLDEVKQLQKWRHLHSLNTVGYKELFQYLDGQMSLEEAVEKIKQHTRNYAKRQMTWFRNQQDFLFFKPEQIDEMKSYLISTIETYSE